MFKVFKECHDWAKLMHVSNLSELNSIVSKGQVEDLIRIDETLQSNRLLEVAKTIVTNKKIKNYFTSRTFIKWKDYNY